MQSLQRDLSMGYDKKELMALSDQEKLDLAGELWDSVEENAIPVSEEQIAFAEERLKMHKANPDEGMTWEELRKRIRDQHGF